MSYWSLRAILLRIRSRDTKIPECMDITCLGAEFRSSSPLFKQVLLTDPYHHSISLLRSICYPEAYQFSTKATVWVAIMKGMLCLHTKHTWWHLTKISTLINACGFYISTDHPFLGATPDALVQCACCGEGTLEVKCPLCAQNSSIAQAIDTSKNFCLYKQSDGKF